MASRLARKKLMDEEIIGAGKRRRITAPESTMTAKQVAVAEKQAKMMERTKTAIVPQTQPDVETAPVNPPTTINTRQDMSNTLKEIMSPSQPTKQDTITPTLSSIQNNQNIRYDPETDRTQVVSSTPSQNLETIQKVISSIPSSQSSVPAVSSRATVEAQYPKRSYETPQQYSERIDRVVASNQKLASQGISQSDKASAIVSQAQDITSQRKAEQEAQAKTQQAYASDPWVQERMAMKESRAKEDAFFNPIVQGLTDTMDVLVHALPVLGGSAGGVLAQAYKNFAPPTSQFYQDKSMGDKTVSFLKDNVNDKLKDLGTGIAMSQVKNGVNLVKGYRPVSISNKTATKNFGIGTPSVNNPVAPLREGSSFYVPRTTAPATPNIPIAPLPKPAITQAPQRLQAQRTDNLINQRRTNVVRR
jgi:hypothetical protein